jgi:uncharacterized iron-regulated protein
MKYCLAVLVLVAWPAGALDAEEGRRASIWIDLVAGEPVEYAEMLGDLAGSRVIYLGERHSVARHHQIQSQLLADLAGRKVALVLGLEQIEACQQPAVERFNRGEIDFAGLAKAIGWGRRWPNYEQYRPLLETARQHGVPVLALNARPETIRQVARGGGVAKLPAESRKELPPQMQLADPLYEKLLAAELSVHMAATPERLRLMIEAQIARDETMAEVLAGYLRSEQGRRRTAVVICGAGHATYGLATVARVRGRLPGVRDRVVLLSESGDVELSPEEKAASRPVEITHQQLSELNRPAGDYLYATEIRSPRLAR